MEPCISFITALKLCIEFLFYDRPPVGLSTCSFACFPGLVPTQSLEDLFQRGKVWTEQAESARISSAVRVRRQGFFSWLTTDQMFATRKITSSLFSLPFVSSLGFALTAFECFYSVKHNRALTADDTSGKCNNKTQIWHFTRLPTSFYAYCMRLAQHLTGW